MDIVKRRDPANLNHKMTLAEMRALTPNFSWDEYLQRHWRSRHRSLSGLHSGFFQGHECADQSARRSSNGRLICAGSWF